MRWPPFFLLCRASSQRNCGLRSRAAVELRAVQTFWRRLRHQRSWGERQGGVPNGGWTKVGSWWPRLAQCRAIGLPLLPPLLPLPSASLVSWSADGSSRWEVSLKGQAVLPLLSYQGQVVVSDGYSLEWLDRDGHLLYPPVQLFPVRGQLFDLSITLSTSIVTMVYKCGFLSTYTVGRPCLHVSAFIAGLFFYSLFLPILSLFPLMLLQVILSSTLPRRCAGGWTVVE